MAPNINIHVLKALVWIFGALLPPSEEENNNDEEQQQSLSLYERLGLSSNGGGGGGEDVSQEDIRRAYKKKSLQLHPDKIAQFRERHSGNKRLSDEEIGRQFQEVKEAYDILSDPDKRRIYDGFSGSSIGITILNHPEQLIDPMNISRNLGQASFCNKSKLMILVLLFFGFLLCQPILICSKIDQTLSAASQPPSSSSSSSDDNKYPLANTKWILIFIPIWFFSTLIILLLSTMTILTASSSSSKHNPNDINDDNSNSNNSSQLLHVTSNLIKVLCIVTQFIFLALRWDQYIHWKYAVVLIPLFAYQALEIIHAVLSIHIVHSDIAKMITLDYLERKVLNDFQVNTTPTPTPSPVGRKYEDLNDVEKDEISKQYIIVHLPPGVEEQAAQQFNDILMHRENNNNNNNIDDDDLSNDQMEMYHKVTLSPEYQERMTILDKSYSKLQSILIFRVAFFVLLVLKLQQSQNDWDWFLVFVPLWVEIGWNIIKSCYIYCCLPNSNGYIIEPSSSQHKSNNNNHNNSAASYRSSSSSNLSHTDAAAIIMIDEEAENTKAALQEPLVPTNITSATDTTATIPSTSNNNNNNNINVKRASGSNYPDMSPLYAKEDMNVPTTTTTKVTNVTPIISGKVPSNSSDSGKSSKDGKSAADQQQQKASSSKYDTYEWDDELDDIDEDVESKIMETQMKACSTCCTQICLSILLSLFLVKLNQADAFVKHLTTDAGYSSFWVLFPPFLMCGIIFCFCCLTIYSGLDPDSIANIRNNNTDNNNNNNNNDATNPPSSSTQQQQQPQNEPIIITPPPNNTSSNATRQQQAMNNNMQNQNTTIEEIQSSCFHDELD